MVKRLSRHLALEVSILQWGCITRNSNNNQAIKRDSSPRWWHSILPTNLQGMLFKHARLYIWAKGVPNNLAHNYKIVFSGSWYKCIWLLPFQKLVPPMFPCWLLPGYIYIHCKWEHAKSWCLCQHDLFITYSEVEIHVQIPVLVNGMVGWRMVGWRSDFALFAYLGLAKISFK